MSCQEVVKEAYNLSISALRVGAAPKDLEDPIRQPSLNLWLFLRKPILTCPKVI
jgi:hypothetical protein